MLSKLNARPNLRRRWQAVRKVVSGENSSMKLQQLGELKAVATVQKQADPHLRIRVFVASA
jgi:hypothetical protein